MWLCFLLVLISYNYQLNFLGDGVPFSLIYLEGDNFVNNNSNGGVAMVKHSMYLYFSCSDGECNSCLNLCSGYIPSLWGLCFFLVVCRKHNINHNNG